jgi:hypothetical protein
VTAVASKRLPGGAQDAGLPGNAYLNVGDAAVLIGSGRRWARLLRRPVSYPEAIMADGVRGHASDDCRGG